MIIKEAILQEELNRVEKFLNKFDLILDKTITKTLYVEDDYQNIIGTISTCDYIIKCLAVDNNYQSENLASLLVNEVLNDFRINKIYNYQVFTKHNYKNVFLSLGFKEIIETEKVIMLEGGAYFIKDKISEMKNVINNTFSYTDESSDIGCVVINGNPLTNGHMQLIEYAARKHKMLLLFVVEENKSMFSFEERFSMTYLCTRRLQNVCVLPSSNYIVSSSTFPSYFLKSRDEALEEYNKIDALIFEKYFIKELFIKKRYVGQETRLEMVDYNNTLKDILKDKLEIIDRYTLDDEIISASKVRSLIEKNDIDEALKYIPKEIAFIFRSIVSSKYE